MELFKLYLHFSRLSIYFYKKIKATFRKNNHYLEKVQDLDILFLGFTLADRL